MLKNNKNIFSAMSILLLVLVTIIFVYFLLADNYLYQCKDCNVILISLSNTGARHMSLYGYERDTTPNLDRWAKDALVFENAFAQSSWTLPVAASFFYLFVSIYP